MDHDQPSVPYKEIQRLCNLLGVKLNIYLPHKALQQCISKVIIMQKEASASSWRDNPDRMGGAFTQEEIDNAKAWK